MSWCIGLELYSVIPRSRWGETLGLLVAEYGRELSVLGWYIDLLLLMCLYCKVCRCASDATLFCQLANYFFFVYPSDGGVFLHQIYTSEHYREVFDVNSAMCPAEFWFERS